MSEMALPRSANGWGGWGHDCIFNLVGGLISCTQSADIFARVATWSFDCHARFVCSLLVQVVIQLK